MNGPDRAPYRLILQDMLLARPAKRSLANDPARFILASIIAGQAAGCGCLPAHLGLPDESYYRMLALYFPGAAPAASERRLGELPEHGDLVKLLLAERAHERKAEIWLADILATACTGQDHLWQDLGLHSRGELSKLMWIAFPGLARANTDDMKWKKFLYRQVCSREGIYVCPAPSCGVCQDYAKCFGPEN